MPSIPRIITEIDHFLKRKGVSITTPAAVGPWLERKGLLKDSSSRPGGSLRKLLRNGEIKHAYQVGNKWMIPHSGNTTKNSSPSNNSPAPSVNEKVPKAEHKLEIVAKIVGLILINKYKTRPDYVLEYKPEWLLSFPTPALIESFPEINKVYSGLVGNEMDLLEQLAFVPASKKAQKQAFDIWIGEPYNFAVEFDEKQHFNQYRRLTLDFYQNFKVNFPLQKYKEYNDNVKITPGRSGFTKLKSKDPLFPELLTGEAQDNRVRQRAFRDFLKDVMPIYRGFNPTLRIPYHVTNGNIKNFTPKDLNDLKNYLLKVL